MEALHNINYDDIRWERRRVLLNIDSETIRKAKELGLNLSKVSENALKEAITRISAPKAETIQKVRAYC
jgi:post-segregation antitoxin (ccd killing protein)